MTTGERYTEITLDDMERFLKRAYRALKPKKSVDRGQFVYDLNLSDGTIIVRVYTAIHPRQEVSNAVGEDSIRVVMITGKGKALMPKAKLVMRTKNWRNALQDRIEDFLEVYESKIEYWKEQRKNRDDGTKRDEGTERDVSPIPLPKSGDLIKGGYGMLPNGDWGAQVPAGCQPGDLAMLETKGGGRKQKVKLLEKQGTNRFGDLWTYERLKTAEDDTGEVKTDAVARSVAARYLQLV